MTKDSEKTSEESKERKKMPQGFPKKKSSRLWEWQRYVKKETQRLIRNKESKPAEEITKPPLPKGPEKRKKQQADNGNPKTASVSREIRTEDLTDVDTRSEFDRDLDILLSDSGVELDDTLKDWVKTETKTDAPVKEKTKSSAKTKTKPKKKDAKSKSETLELFSEELDKARRKKQSPRRTREHLIENLLDPVISLDEAAVILNVCKTTVRRYTNAGKLECLRTPGNQRRFRLSKVLEFLEEKEGRKASRSMDD